MSNKMKAETSRMKKKKKAKKTLGKYLRKEKPSYDELSEKLGGNVGSDAGPTKSIKGQPPGTTRRQYVRKRMADKPPPQMEGESEAVDEYYGPGTAKKLLRTRKEQAYDSMRGKNGGGAVRQGRGMGAALRGGGAVTRS